MQWVTPEIGPNVLDKVVRVGYLERLEEIYLDETSHDDLHFTSKQFLWRIGARIYTEWCLELENRDKPTLEKITYHGQAFEKFIDDEILYEEMRAMKRDAASLFAESRNRVLRAVVTRGIDFVRNYPDWNDDPSEGVYMRTDLSKWM